MGYESALDERKRHDQELAEYNRKRQERLVTGPVEAKVEASKEEVPAAEVEE